MIAPVAAWPPAEGYYATTLVKNGPRVAVRIWWGPPEIDGEIQDRSPRWNVEVDGRTDHWEKNDDGYRCRVGIEVDRFWPYVARKPITEAEYRFLIADAEHARAWRPDHPKAQPRRAVDWLNSNLPF